MSLNKPDIEALINRYKKTYIDNPSVMISGFTQENQIVADYNGRQILELMQNADDAGSDIIHIEIDTTNQTLCISNKGSAFDIGGIESLMFPGISTKNKTEFIGNKGLGFRSILNWVDSVTILTREVSVSFSREHTEKFFNTHLDDEASIKDRVEQERSKSKITNDTLPIATLAFPEITNEVADAQYTTQIKLVYNKNEEAAIEAQLSSIAEETLLFLPHSTKVVLVKNGQLLLNLNKSTEADGSIKVGSKSWKVLAKNNLVFDEKVRFNYTIAWQDDLSDNGMFYTYFPTDVATGLPCLIHGTFDLTNNRKELNKCNENEFILNHIAESLAEIAHNYLKPDKFDWRAFKFLSPNYTNNRSFFKPFYNLVVEKRESNYCYPAVNNQYINKDSAVFYSNTFSDWVAENHLGDSFKQLIKSTEFDIEINSNDFNKYGTDEWSEIAKAINSRITDHSQRAKLIKLLLDECQLNLSDESKLPLLIGQDYTFEAGTYHENVFAYRAIDQNLNLPEFANITFVNTDFYDELLKFFSQDINQKRENNEDVSRTLIRIIKPVVTLRQNDSNEVIRYIVSELNKQEQTADKIRSLIHFLFNLFDENTERKNKLAFDIPLLSRANKITNSTQLIFGDDYASGQHTELIFENVYDNNRYLASKDDFGLNELDNSELVHFFSWLGVQNYFIAKTNTISTPTSDSYFQFLFNEKKEDKPDNAKTNNIELKATIIENLADLERLNPNNLCLLLEKSPLLRRAINFNNEHDLNYLTYKYGNAYAKEINTGYSYIYFQISKLIDFKQYTLSEDSEFELLYQKFDLESEFFITNLTKSEIESLKLTLKRLGVAESIDDITEERLKSVLEKQEEVFTEGRGSQNFYKKCLEFYLKHSDNLGISYCDEYYGRKGLGSDNLELISKNTLYYSDNYLLPRKILNNFYFINLPKRAGEENIKNIFGVKLIKDELNALEIIDQKTHQLSIDFNKYFQSLKPFILAYRIDVMKDKTSKQAEAKALKKLSIILVTELSIKFNNDTITLEENEFIPIGETIYIKTGHKNNKSELLSTFEFCDAIAEVVCIAFKISNLKNTFRRVIKDGIAETSHILKTDEKENLLTESKELLGINSNELDFWKKIFPSESLDGIDTEDFYSHLKSKMNLKLPETFSDVDFSNLGNKLGVNFLSFILEQTDMKLYQLIQPNTLGQWHKENLENAIRDYSQLFRFLLWQKANVGNVGLKKKFHQDYVKFNNASILDYFKTFIENYKYELYPDYKKELFEFANNEFVVNLGGDFTSVMDIENKYTRIIQSYNIGIDLEDTEKIINANYPEVFSLLFFEGFEDEIKNTLDQLKTKVENDDSVGLEDTEDESVVIISDSRIKATSPRVQSQGMTNGDYAHTSQVSKKKALAGKKEENKVIKALKKGGFEVIPVSKTSDSKHYDLEYKKPGGEWRFLEVKKDSGGFFFMSKAEKNTAINDANVRKYDIAIVSGNKIHIIESPFLLNNETFENNTKFFAEPSDYVIHFNLESNKE
ncbi:MAG: hypothetical protein CFE24_14740 [Flavobacterium sp. BFFFF2]|nr:MAG: hypothetical protein CFE24_14740 [Flavobacterium sp. BFFFF2]